MLLFLSYGALLIISFLFYRRISRYAAFREKLKNVPGPDDLPLVGTAWKLTEVSLIDRFEWFNNLCFQFKNGVVSVWIGAKPFVIIRKPHQIQTVLSNRKISSKSSRSDALRPWLGAGLLTANGEKWSTHRQLLTPMLHLDSPEKYFEIILEKVSILIDCIDDKLKKDPKEPVNVFKLAERYALDTVCKAVMGVDVDSQLKAEAPYIEALHTLAKLEQERFIRPWLKWDMVYNRTEDGIKFADCVKTMHNFTAKMIEQKLIEKEERYMESRDDNYKDNESNKKEKRKSFLDLLLEQSISSKDPLTLKEIREEVDTIVYAGHDATAAAISWTLLALGNEPEVQVKLQRELNDILGTHPNRTPTLEEINHLQYLDRAIQESFRMYPANPSISRSLDEDVKIDDHVIPKGTNIVIHVYQCHNDPEVWKDPKKFDPDRFLPGTSRHPFAFIPFGAGARKCVGQKFGILQMKLVLSAILRRWRLSSILKPSEISIIDNFVLKPIDNKIEIAFTPIS